MINLLGFLIIVCGFVTTYLRGVQVSMFFFWTGFLLILWPTKYFLKTSAWPKWVRKWARIGLLLNILETIFLMGLIQLEYFNLFHKLFNIFNPVGLIINFLFPIEMPVEKIVFGSFRSTTIIFFNVLAYIGLGIVIGKLLSLKHGGRKTQYSS